MGKSSAATDNSIANLHMHWEQKCPTACTLNGLSILCHSVTPYV